LLTKLVLFGKSINILEVLNWRSPVSDIPAHTSLAMAASFQTWPS